MKSKHSTVCHTCRAHKIGCDGKRPACSQCIHTGRKCQGYQRDLSFVPYASKGSPRKRTPSKKASPPSPATQISNDTVNHYATNQWTHVSQFSEIPRVIAPAGGEFTATILSCFVPKEQQNLPSFDLSTSQVCGAWVGVLPNLITLARAGGLITSATRALGMLIYDRSSSRSIQGPGSLEAYNDSLQRLRTALMSPKFSRLETAAAIACLAMVELMLPTSHVGSGAHFSGLAALIRSYSPDSFRAGTYHALFVGCRPVLMFQALTARKSTFLARAEWLTVPFQELPPSDMQMLIGDVALVPSIMEIIDALPFYSAAMAASCAATARKKLLTILTRLAKWEFCARSHSTEFPTPDPDEPGDIPTNGSAIWFPSLLVANLHIHAWAFQIICLLELEKLRPYAEDDSPSRQQSTPNTSSLAILIICSMDYMLRDDNRLHGPASALFPLSVAYAAFSKNGGLQQANLEQCRLLFNRISQKGFWAMPFFEQSTIGCKKYIT